ncbi:glycosyltransferase family 4 protein [Flavobacterium sp.]|uniref:glycosyltransferase family 4 protein n=1 Tax=Flavobacterium sp. TaxID=239 RepID=UPI0026353282|nr:glycosyltransferase family 4 protein [Flavobacterium sp.]
MEIIHIVLGKANPNRMNGVNKVVYNLATKQAEFGKKVAVWGITKDLKKNYGERNFETRLFLRGLNPFAIPSGMKKAILEKKGKAVFHIHGGWIPVFSGIGKVMKQNNIDFVFTPHGAYNSIAMDRSFWIKRMYFNLFELHLLKNSTKIHCIGKSETVGLKCLYKNKKTILVPYGFENENTISMSDSKNKDIVFGFIGRLDIYTKGLDTLIKAFKKHTLKNPNSKLWIVGDSKEKEKLYAMIVDNNLQNNIILFGEKFGKEKEDLLQQMDIFVHPSRNEGLPTSVIEAASYGKPCIVTDATNIGDLIYQFQAGDMIFEHNSNHLEKSMNKLAIIWQNQNEFIKIRRNAIRMVKENFNWRRVIQDFNTKLYKA